MAVLIRNKSFEPLSLPWPFQGVLSSGKDILLNLTAAQFIAALGGSANVIGALDISDVPAPASYSAADALYLGHYVTGVQPSDVGVAVPVTAGVPASLVAVDSFLVQDFVVGVTGTADDVTIVDVTPAKWRIIGVSIAVTTVKAGATGQLFTAPAGGGTALSSAISVTSTGVIASNITTGLPTLAKGSAIYLRRSDRAFAGSLIINYIITP